VSRSWWSIRSRAQTLLAVLLAADGCGGDGTGPRGITVTLTLCALPNTPGGSKVCAATSAAPLQAVEVTAVATPSASFPVNRIVISAAGLITRADTFAADNSAAGPGIAVDTTYLPGLAGAVTFTATASGPAASGTSSPMVLAVADTEPPVVTGVTLVPHDSLEPGDSVFVDVTATDNSAVTRVVVRGMGALVGVADTLLQGGPSVSQRARFRVPPAATYGTPVSFDVRAMDVVDLSSPQVSSGVLTLGDFTPPAISGANANGPSSDPLVPGDTLRGAMDAADNHKLAWVGYRVGQPAIAQDSFPVTGKGGQYAFNGIVAQSWVGTDPLRLFARDSSGNEGIFNLQVRVLDAVRKPVRASSGQAGIQDYIYDAKRNTLYFMNTFTIGVLPVATMAFGTPIALPTEARGYHMDLTPSSDSIVFANQLVTDSVFVVLATVDLTQTARTVDTAHVARDPVNTWPAETGVVSGDQAFIPILSMTGFGELDEFDLATRTETRRSDAGESGNIPTFVLFLPNADRTRMAMIWSNLGQIYRVAGDAFSAPVTLPSGGLATGDASVDSAGTRYLLGGTLLDDNLAVLRTFDFPSSPGFPNTAVVSAISPDGTVAYFSQTVDGTDRALVLKVRVSDGVVVGRMLVPTVVGRLMALPDGNTLVGVARDNSVLALDVR